MCYHFNPQINYAICDTNPTNANAEQHTGLRLYDLDEAIKSDGKYKSILMKNYQVGCNSSFFYSASENRVAYFNTIKYCTIVPLLHSNVIKFVGLTDPENYLAYKVIKDKLIALDNKGVLQMWNTINGKFISSTPTGQNFDEYEIHSPAGPMDSNGELKSRDADDLLMSEIIKGYSNRQNKAILRTK